MCRTTILLLAFATVALARSAGAQPVPMVGDRGPAILVTMKDGAQVEGALVVLGDSSVTLTVDQRERTIPLAAISRIEREGDGSGDGATKGAVILGLLCALVCGQGTANGGEHLRVIASNAALGALGGWVFDRGHRGRTRIYPPPVDWGAAFAHATPPATVSPAAASEPPTTPPAIETPDTAEVTTATDLREPSTLVEPPAKRHAISVSPFGLAHGHAALEYERRAASWLGVGVVVARTWRPSVWVGREQVAPDARQVLTDAVVRVYPGGHVFSGAAFGLRAGLGTSADERSFGAGYELAYSWTLDARGHISLGASQERAYAVVRGRRTGVGWPLLRLAVGVVF